MACTNVTMTEAFCLNDGERTFLVALTSMDLVICVCMLLVGLWRFALVALSKRQLDKPVLDFQCLILVLLICFPILRLIPIDAGPNLLNVTGGFRGALFLCHLSILMLTWALIANFFATIVSKFHPPTVLVLRLLYAFMAIWGGVVLVAIATTAATGDHKAGSALANLATVIYIVSLALLCSAVCVVCATRPVPLGLPGSQGVSSHAASDLLTISCIVRCICAGRVHHLHERLQRARAQDRGGQHGRRRGPERQAALSAAHRAAGAGLCARRGHLLCHLPAQRRALGYARSHQPRCLSVRASARAAAHLQWSLLNRFACGWLLAGS